jgi:hypothetical protein
MQHWRKEFFDVESRMAEAFPEPITLVVCTLGVDFSLVNLVICRHEVAELG